MKIAIVFAAFVLTASAYRCKFDRYATGAPNLLCITFNENLKKGDQTEKDSCSNVHTYSCYTQHHGTEGDPNCRLVIYDGAGCNAEANKLILPCTGGLRGTKAEPHSYRVECD